MINFAWEPVWILTLLKLVEKARSIFFWMAGGRGFPPDVGDRLMGVFGRWLVVVFRWIVSVEGAAISQSDSISSCG